MVLDLDEFIEDCKNECFIDSDGYGYYSNSRRDHEQRDDMVVYPSDIMKGKINHAYKYVHWYNR